MFTIGIFELSLFVILIAVGYFVGRAEGRTRGVEAAVSRLVENGFLKYRENIKGELEFVPHTEK